MLALALLTVRANADANDGEAEARQHFKSGSNLYDLGKYDDAVVEYEKAYQLSARPAPLFNIGQAYRLANKPQKAIAAYQSYLRRMPNAPQRAETERQIAALEKALRAEEERAASAITPNGFGSTQTAVLGDYFYLLGDGTAASSNIAYSVAVIH